MTEENGYLIEYNTKWIGKLAESPNTEKCGWKVFFKDGTFAGILDEDKLAIWRVKEDSLYALAVEENEQYSYDAQREYMEMQAMYLDNHLEC